MEDSRIEDISELLSKAIVEYRRKGRVDEDLLKKVEELISEQEKPLLVEHLRNIVRSFREGSFEERSLLGKSLRLDRKELEGIIGSIEKFMSEEPFKDMDSKELLFLWERSLIKMMGSFGEGDYLGSETETTSG